MLNAVKKFSQTLVLCLFAWVGHAQDGISVEENGYRVFYSVFNSTMITPKVAQAYDLERDGDLAYVNVVVTKVEGKGQSLGVPASIQGSAKNLMQQVQKLTFKTIQEQNTVYYLAPVSHGNEEVFHFQLAASPINGEHTIDIKFTKKLFVE